jgi:hypothetical protein
MKWLKRLLTIVALGLLAIIAFCLVGIYLYRGTPSWYHRRVATTQEVRDAANSADQKLIDLFSWAASTHAEQIRRIRGVAKSADQPVGPKTVTFSEDELNSFFSTWKSPDNGELEQRISRYFADGRVIFQPDAVILAGQSPTLDALVSAEFDPAIDSDGNLHLQLGSLRAGRLPIPRSMVQRYLDRLHLLLVQELEVERSNAKIDNALAANGSALAASWLRLLVSGLDGRATDPVLIIPFDMTHLKTGLPVTVTGVSVGEGQITLTLNPIAPDQRQEILESLKRPYGAARE